jgi:hypothetical protein
MRYRRSSKYHRRTASHRLQVLEVHHELDTLKCDKHSQYYPEEIEPTWAVRIAPTLNICDYTHIIFDLVSTKFTEKPCQSQCYNSI